MACNGNSDMTLAQRKIVPDEMKKQAFRICCDYLHGRWKKIKPNDMDIKHISGGLSNLLYYCALPKSSPPVGREPAEVLVRFYGQVHGEEKLESLLAESVIFTLLSERRLGPRLHGVFPGGRIEEYIHARSLTSNELADTEISRQIAVRMAKMHSLDIPIIKDPTWIWNSLGRWQKSSEEFLLKANSKNNPKILERLREVDYGAEIEFLKLLLSKFPSPVVFAHNDLQEGNILLNENAKTADDRISLIDFEYCSYNYRGFDLANHFCEWMYSYTNPEAPYFNVHVTDFATQRQLLNFVRSYLRTYDWETKNSNGPPMKEPYPEISEAPPHPSESVLLQEIHVYKMFSHLMWSLWSIVQAHISTINFGYLEYSLVRLEHYFQEKNIIQEKLDSTK